MLKDIVCVSCLLPVLILLVIANGAPVLADRLLNRRIAVPVDLGRKWFDGHSVFGSTKTWRGVLVSVCLSGLTAGFLGMDTLTGIRFGFLVMLGDLSSSFLKRRLGLSESSQARGLDTVPESVLPAAVLKESLGLGWMEVILVSAGFLLIDEFLSPMLYKLKIRKRPY